MKKLVGVVGSGGIGGFRGSFIRFSGAVGVVEVGIHVSRTSKGSFMEPCGGCGGCGGLAGWMPIIRTAGRQVLVIGLELTCRGLSIPFT